MAAETYRGVPMPGWVARNPHGKVGRWWRKGVDDALRTALVAVAEQNAGPESVDDAYAYGVECSERAVQGLLDRPFAG